MYLIFGRLLIATIDMFGLKVIEDPCSPSAAAACLSAAILAIDGGLRRMDKLQGNRGPAQRTGNALAVHFQESHGTLCLTAK